MHPKNVQEKKAYTNPLPASSRQPQEHPTARAFTNTDYQAWARKLAQDDHIKNINENFGKNPENL